MKKILILCLLILIFALFIYHLRITDTKGDNAKIRLIKHVLKNKDLSYNTEFNDVRNLCYFVSVYSISSIKPEMERINVEYSPFISLKMHTMRVGEGASALVIVQNSGKILPIYIDGKFLHTNDVVDSDRRCIPVDKVKLRIEDKKIYVLH